MLTIRKGAGIVFIKVQFPVPTGAWLFDSGIEKPWPLASSQGLIPYPVRYPSASDIHGMKEVFVQPHASRFILEIRIIIPCRLFTHTTVLHDHVVSWMLRFLQEHISYTRQVSWLTDSHDPTFSHTWVVQWFFKPLPEYSDLFAWDSHPIPSSKPFHHPERIISFASHLIQQLLICTRIV